MRILSYQAEHVIKNPGKFAWRVLKAFKKTLEHPAVLASFEKYDQPVIYLNTEDYTRFARETFVKEKAIIEKLGMALKA